MNNRGPGDVPAPEHGPALVVAAVAVHADRLLLVRADARWRLPAGPVRRGESAAEAVVRVVREQTGLAGVSGGVLGWVEHVEPTDHRVVLEFDVTMLSADDPSDAHEAQWTPLWEVSELRLEDGLTESLADYGILDLLT